VVAYHQKLLDKFLKSFWDYYRKLLAYQNALDEARNRSEFWDIFATQSGYEELDERKQLTAAKMEELLLVLEHPELPLHNNPLN